MIAEILIGLGVLVGIIILCAITWYRIVPAGEAHYVISQKGNEIYSPNSKLSSKRTYFKIPDFIPYFGNSVRRLDINIQEITDVMETYEKQQARFLIKFSLKYKISNADMFANTSMAFEQVNGQIKDNIISAIRAVTVQYDVTEVRAKKTMMDDAIRKEITDDFDAWGLELVNFQLVDFQDTVTSKIISNISLRRETDIQTQTRQEVAEKNKLASIKEAEADQLTKQRQIERDKQVGVFEQEKMQLIADREKDTKEKQLEVTRVQTVKTQNIEKERALVKANQDQQVQEIVKKQQLLKGEGEKLYLEQVALGEAAKVREQLYAEAKGKEELQKALNKFDDKAIRALVAEKIVAMQQVIGVENAKALATADMRVFMGGKSGEEAFNFGQAVAGLNSANDSAASSVLNKIARPNDLGFAALNELNEKVKDKKTK